MSRVRKDSDVQFGGPFGLIVGLLVSVLLMGSCKPGTHKKPPETEDLPYEIVMDGVETFEVGYDFYAPAMFCAAFKIGEDEYLGLTNLKYGKSIHLISFADHSKRIDIHLDSLGKKLGTPLTFDIEDSLIYLAALRPRPEVGDPGMNDTCMIHVIDLSGKYVRSICAWQSKVPEGVQIISHQDAPLQYHDQKLYVGINHYGPTSKEQSKIGYFDIAKDSLVMLPIHLPNEYYLVSQELNRTYFLAELLVGKKALYVSYGASGDVVKIDLDGSRKMDSFDVKSRYLAKLIGPPVNSDSVKEGDGPQQVMKLELTNGKYGRFVEVGNTGNLIRLVFHPNTGDYSLDAGASTKYKYHRLGSLMATDSEMKLIAESDPMRGFTPGGVFSREDGEVYVQDMEQTNEDLRDAGKIVFQKFRLERKPITKSLPK